MMLSPQLFDRIVGISSSRESDHKGTVLPAGCRRAPERRQAARIAFGQRTLICRDSGPAAGVWQTVMLQDISQRGIGFLSDEPIPGGQTFMLKLTDKEGDTLRIRCIIRRCERGGFGGTAFLAGAEFQQVIAYQPIRVTDEKGEEEIPGGSPLNGAVQADEATVGTSAARGTSVMARLRSLVDPSQWLRKSDDFSSLG
jgi:hypothetical protein